MRRDASHLHRHGHRHGHGARRCACAGRDVVPGRRRVNRFHRWYCRSSRWQRTVEERLLPWVLGDVDLGERVLEVGPGPGLTTAVLAGRCSHVTAVEIDRVLAEALRRRSDPARVEVVNADATAMPFPDATFSGAVSFTMLHHVPTAELQDRLLAEVHRVLAPGAVFAGSDSLPGPLFRAAHLFDTMVPVDPRWLPQRLERAGFHDVQVGRAAHQLRFLARA
jgi:SAM-dependent methyltransferase